MADTGALKQVREGAEVRTSDGTVVGKVVRVWFGSDTGERHSFGQMKDDEGIRSDVVPDAVVEVDDGSTGETMYIPHQAVSDVSEDCVTLHVGENAVETSTWHEKPPWMGRKGD
jgi:hypothetical protein